MQPWVEKRRAEDGEAGPVSVTGNYGSTQKKGTQMADFLY